MDSKKEYKVKNTLNFLAKGMNASGIMCDVSVESMQAKNLCQRPFFDFLAVVSLSQYFYSPAWSSKEILTCSRNYDRNVNTTHTYAEFLK